MGKAPSLHIRSVPVVVVGYLVVCSAFNLLCARAMNLDVFAIRTVDLLFLIQLPGLVISGSGFLLAILRQRRSGLWDLIALLTILASTLGIVVVIFAVALPVFPERISHLRPKLTSSPHYPRTAFPSSFDHIDQFTSFAFAALDTWLCLALLSLLRWFRGLNRER